MTGSTPGDALFIESIRRRRDLAVLLLLDVSGSASDAVHVMPVKRFGEGPGALQSLLTHVIGPLFSFSDSLRGVKRLIH
jgi:uncharacterized protein with von Willebrand factor type A (vWA) domain